jgi:hypothetical protein
MTAPLRRVPAPRMLVVYSLLLGHQADASGRPEKVRCTAHPEIVFSREAQCTCCVMEMGPPKIGPGKSVEKSVEGCAVKA